MVIDLNELKKLSPEERIKKLKELETERKKEIEEAENIIKSSIEEIDERDELVRKIEVPDLEEISYGKSSSLLEETVQSESNNLSPEAAEEAMKHSAYITSLSKQPMDELYQRILGINGNVEKSGDMNEDDKMEFYVMNRAIAQKQKDIEEGIYNTSERVDKSIDTGRRILDELMEIYKR